MLILNYVNLSYSVICCLFLGDMYHSFNILNRFQLYLFLGSVTYLLEILSAIL